MAKGGARPGAGRPEGSKNKKSILDTVRETYPDYDPIIAMVEMANDCATITTEDGNKLELQIDINIRMQCHKEVAKYCYPTLKAIELTGKDGEAIQIEGTWIPPSSPAKSKS